MTHDAWRITGGRPLRGAVHPSGSKNGALPLLAATLLVDGETVLANVPRIADTLTMVELLRAFGLAVEERAGGALVIANRGIATHAAPVELVSRMRASHYLLAPLVSRLGRAELPLPGGCDIGERPVGYILDGLAALGAEAAVNDDRIAITSRRLRGGVVSLNPAYRSPGATFNALMAAALAEGETVIENASFEPDVVSFCRFLIAAGACLEGAGGPRLVVRGVRALGGTSHRVNTDRLEAGTFLLAAAATRGDVKVTGIGREELAAAVDAMVEAGIELEATDDWLRGAAPARPRAVSIATEPFPGFPTDLQPPFAAVLACAEGTSTVRESIFDRRLQYVEQLAKMGACMRLIDSRQVSVRGVDRLRGEQIEAHNIRDGAALVVAALGAQGESVVSGRQYVARGYENFDDKLRSIGAEIELAG